MLFCDYVRHKLDDSVSPEEALSSFEDFQSRLVMESYDAVKNTGVFFDMYHPLSKIRLFDLRLRSVQLNAEAFHEDLQKGRYQGLVLKSSSHEAGSCSVAIELQPPYFALSPDAATLLMTIPASLSAWVVYDALQEQPGLVSVAWSKPRNSLVRELRARFSSQSAARSAVTELSKAKDTAGLSKKGSFLPRPSLLTPPAMSALVVPPEMSGLQRLEKDEQLARCIIERLDEISGVRSELTAALLNQDGSLELKLDLKILYLRRVHHFCFYGAKWCEDEWQLYDHCGAVLIRDGHAAEVPAEGEWSAAHQLRLQRFLATASLLQPTDGANDPSLKVRLASVSKESMRQVSDSKFECLQCHKYFKGPDYVTNHLWKAHVELFEAVREDFMLTMAKDAYVADSSRPLSAM